MYIPQLTFTRFLAAFAIVVFHYGQSVYPFDLFTVHKFVRVANSAISFFFVLSGFVMVLAYYKRRNNFDRKKYFIARFSRIYPAYIVGLVLVIFYLAKYNSAGIYFWEVVSHTLLLQAWIPGIVTKLNTPGWTLSVELFFYILFPAVFLLLLKLSQKKAFFLMMFFWVMNLVIHVYLYQNYYDYHHVIFYNPVLHLLTFVQGVLLGIVFVRFQKREVFEKFSWIFMGSSILIFFLFILFSKDWYQYHHNGMFVPLFGLFIFGLSVNSGFLKKLFSLKPLIILGEMSYGVYILQIPVYLFYIKTVEKFDINMGEQQSFWIYVLFLLVCSYILYAFFEKPLRNFLRKVLIRG